jgi:hypothetical protein
LLDPPLASASPDEDLMKKQIRKIQLSRETLLTLDASSERRAAAGASLHCSGQDTCSVDYCPTLTCGVSRCVSCINPTTCM